MRSERMSPPSVTGQFFHHVERRVGLEAGDDPAADGVELGPPGVVVIAEIEDIGGARLDRHLLGHGDVVDVGRGDCGIDRAIGIGIVNHVHFGTADPGREPRPAGAALVQPHARGIDQIGCLGELAPQAAMGLLHHHRQQVGEHCGRSLCVRIREGRSPNRVRAHMVEPRRMARKSRHDLAQARRTRKLAIEQRHELALGRQSAHPRIGPMVFHKRCRTDAMEHASEVREIRYSDAAWLDPSPCPRTLPNVLEHRRINAMRFVHKNPTGQPWVKPGDDKGKNSMPPPVFRFAPSPNGFLHLGHAFRRC